jgi:hypothetical protein
MKLKEKQKNETISFIQKGQIRQEITVNVSILSGLFRRFVKFHVKGAKGNEESSCFDFDSREVTSWRRC